MFVAGCLFYEVVMERFGRAGGKGVRSGWKGRSLPPSPLPLAAYAREIPFLRKHLEFSVIDYMIISLAI